MRLIKLGLLAGIWAFAFVPARAAEPIRIGVIGPFTGGSAAMGVSMLQGIKIAADEINEAGGIPGRRLVLVERNDEANNDGGAQIAEDLTENQLVDAAVGFVNTGVALAALPYFQEARIPLVLSVTTGSLLTRQFDSTRVRGELYFPCRGQYCTRGGKDRRIRNGAWISQNRDLCRYHQLRSGRPPRFDQSARRPWDHPGIK